MTTDEMVKLNEKFIADVWPLYRELHTLARYELAKKYNAPVPELLPAHWIPNRWAQDWGSLVNVEGLDLDKVVGKESPGVGGQAGRSLLRQPRLPVAAASLLGEVLALPGARRRHVEEEQSRQRLAPRPRARRAQPDERAAQRPLVEHHPPRARPHLLLPFLHPSGGAAAPPRRRQPRLPRSGRHHDGHGLEPEELPGRQRHDPGRHQDRRRPGAAQGSPRLGGFPALRGRHHDPLRARPLRRQPAQGSVQRPLVALREDHPGRGPAHRARRSSSATRPRRPTSTTTPPSTTTTPSPACCCTRSIATSPRRS